ncbi:butyrate kinase [bacterium]|nr:MAG: butyrate kinase [bacterium]
MNRRAPFILVVNPGSTSTKVAIFKGDKEVVSKNIEHPREELAQFEGIIEQKDYRRKLAERVVDKLGIKLSDMNIVVGRGGPLKPLEGGVYRVSEKMVKDIESGKTQEQHSANLGAVIAYEIASKIGAPAYIVDPISTDEMSPVAKLTGIPGIKRRSLTHALNVKACARRYAREAGMNWLDLNIIVAHLGGGITVNAVKNGRIVDVSDARQDGPIAPTAAGRVPGPELSRFIRNSNLTEKQLVKFWFGKGGGVALTGTDNVRELLAKRSSGDKQAKLFIDALTYGVAKEIGALSTIFRGNVDASILTGDLAQSNELTEAIKRYVEFIAAVIIYPGEFEMEALAEGGVRVWNGEEKEKTY